MKLDSATCLEKLVIRTPQKGASLQPYQLQNEVGFLNYIEKNLPNIPAPKVYSFDDGTTGSTSTAYIAAEYIEGRPLSRVWLELSDEQKATLYEEIANIVADLAETRFKTIGSFGADGKIGPTVEGVKIFSGRVSAKFLTP